MKFIRTFFAVVPATLLAALLLVPAPAVAAAPDAAFVEQLREALKQHPDLVLDVLRSNSEVVLDVATQGADLRRKQTLIKQWQMDMENPKEANIAGRPMRGPEKAPVTMVAFSDFTCTYCQQAAFTVEELLKRYPEKIRFVFKQVPPEGNELGRLASQWFLAAFAQDPYKAWPFYMSMFEKQRQLVTDPTNTLLLAATEAGLDSKALQASVRAQAKSYDKIIDEDLADAKRLGFMGTPYFMVNNLVIRGSLPLENLIDAVDMALKATK